MAADKSSELRMNLAAIKRVDPYAKDIIDSSAHVAFYTFNPDETEWEKTDVEGAFFVYSRNAEPFNSVFINNRLNTNSLVEPITAGIELQNQTPFLLYRNERNRIRGFWFYNRSECDRISDLLQRIVKESEPLTDSQKSGELASNIPQHAFDLMQYSNDNVDIFSMLSKAQQDFNNSLSAPNAKSIAVGTDTKQKLHANDTNERKNLPPKSGPVPMPVTNQSNIGTSQSVMNFFAAAKPAQPKEGPFLQRMLSQPVHIDQIEKRVKTPLKEKQQSQNQAAMKPPPPSIMSNQMQLENGLKFMRVNSPTHQQSAAADLGTSPLATFIASNNLTQMKAKDTELENKQTLAAFLKKPTPGAGTTTNVKSTTINSTTPNKPALMPPTMFESTETNNRLTTNTNAKNKSENNETNKKNATSKGKEAGNQRSRKKSSHEQPQQSHQNADLSTTVQPLTETQLLQALSYLMKNDPGFIKKIHEAYLKSFAEMVSH